MKGRPAPEFTVVIRFEGEPELRFVAFTDRDLERLKLWLRRTPVLVDLAEAVLVLLAELLNEEEGA